MDFLKEARDRMPGGPADLFEEAIWYYDLVARSLKRVEELFPFHTRKPEHVEDPRRREGAVEALSAAREAEEAGLGTLARIVDAL